MKTKPVKKEFALSLYGGSVTKLAKALGITKGAVSNWADKKPIPDLQAMRLRYEIRPDAFTE